MKNNILLLSFLLFAGLHAGAQTNAEEAAVKAVIARETESYFAANLEQWSATRTHTENSLNIGHESGSAGITRGWKQELADAAWVKEFPDGIKISVERTNWNIRVSGNVAWATYDQALSVPQFGVKNRRTTEIRCLEKTGGQWTITVLTYTATQKFDTPEELEAIKKVLRDETQAYLDADTAKWSAQHLQDENETLVWNNADGTFGYTVGWASISVDMATDFSKRGKYTDKLSIDNFKFTVRGNLAFVMYDQMLTASDGKISKSREHRVLVWQNGQWKIQAVMAYLNPEAGKK